MIICPNCAHPNPEAATECEACYTPLPALTTCPHCGAPVTDNAEFCGQCGTPLQLPAPTFSTPASPATPSLPDPLAATAAAPIPSAPPVAAPVSGSPAPVSGSPAPATPARTQLQQPSARLLHLQSQALLELPSHLDVIHLGKPNDRIPPDIDVSGFANSEIVSRIHADIRVEGDSYYLEDTGSANGTYVNNLPLKPGNRHRLRPGDRIALGKGDKVSFLFQC